jgi:hypothetical protein
MENLNKFVSISMPLMLVLYVGLASCGGGGGGGGQPSGQGTTIRGNVENVIAMAPKNNRQSVLARIKDFFALSKTANAQDNQIVVSFVVNGEVEDVVTVNPNGDFEGEVPISVSGNNVTLVFESDGDEESVVIFVPPVDAVILVVVVNFQDNEAEVVDTEFEGPLRCENTTISLVAAQDQDIVINGNGGPCVLAGNCHLSFDAENVIFQDCGGCFDTRGNSVLEVSANEDITCDSAPGECLIARGTSSINLSAGHEAGDEINLNCIDARGDSEVILDAFSCIIGEISPVGNATVDTSGCESLGM